MSKQVKKPGRLFRRPSGRAIFIAIVILFPLAIIFSYVDIPGSIALVEHFFTAPKHFTYRGHSDYVSSVAWSPDGKRIAIGGNGDALVWDATTGKNMVTYGYHGGVVHQIVWSPNGRYIAVASDVSVLIWDVATIKNVYTYSGHSGDVFSIAWSPDGKHIASAAGDDTVQVWLAQ